MPAIPQEKLSLIIQLFPHISTKELAEKLGLSYRTISNKAHALGLKKTPKYLSSINAGREQSEATIAAQFKKGQMPHNKGVKMPNSVRIKVEHTMFKAGQTSYNNKPIGYERLGKDGYIQIKTQSGFKPKNRVVWEQHFGAVPAGNIVIFKDGDKLNFNIDNLDIITRADNANRNKIFITYSPEYKEVLGILHKLDKIIKNAEKQNRRP